MARRLRLRPIIVRGPLVMAGVLALVAAVGGRADAATGGPADPGVLRCQGEARVATRLDVRFDLPHRRLTGSVRIHAENPGVVPLDRAYVWLYPNHLARRSPGLDDVNFHWVYPRRFDPGWMRLGGGRVGDDQTAELDHLGPEAFVVRDHPAGPGVLVEVRLPVPVPPGGTFVLELDYDAAVPERYGAFGCVSGRCTLMGGFHPMLAGLDARGWDLEGAPACSTFTGGMTLSHAAAAVAFGRLVRGAFVPIEGAGTHAPVALSPGLHETVRRHRGVTLVYLAGEAPPPGDDAARQIVPYSSEDYGAMVIASAMGALDLAAELGSPLPAGTRLVVVEAPLRQSLAEAHPGMVIISDKLFRIFPVRRFRKFHERELIRALFASYLAARIERSGPDPARVAASVAEVGASYLVDLFTIRQYRKQEFARDLLQPVSFVPAVDQILYAPQVAFVDAYFGRVGEDRFRDDVGRLGGHRPPGRLYYEKLRDLLVPARFAAAMRAVVLGTARFEAAAEAAYGKRLDWFFRQWSQPAPQVNYALGRRTRAELPNGRTRHSIEIRKEAPHGAETVVEPVVVKVVDSHGRHHLVTWDGQGDAGTVTIETSATGLRSVELDPAYRLTEAGLPGSSDDPRLDDRYPARPKFLYNSFGLALNLSDLTVDMLVDFELGWVNDIRNRLRLQLYRTNEVSAMGALTYGRWFGRKVTPSRLQGAWSVGMSAGRLNGGYGQVGDEESLPGTQVALRLHVGSDSRMTWFEPLRARGWNFGARWTITRFDGQDDLRHTIRPYFEVLRLWTPADGHTFAADLEGVAVAGETDSRAQLVAAGGPSLLRGYGAAELFGRARLTGHLEWRGELRHDLDLNLGHLIWLHGLGAAAFVDVGAVSSCGQYGDLFAAKNLFASAGFGLRMFYDDLGVAPGMMAIDFGVPLVLRSRTCLGETTTPSAGGLPFTISLLFVPPF